MYLFLSFQRTHRLYILFLHGLICGFQICRRKEVSWKQSIVSRHLSALRSPVRPFILPPHAEQLAQVLANASSPEAVDVSSGVPLEVERYFDVAAEVGGFSDRLDREISDS